MNDVGIDVSEGKSMIAVMRPFGEAGWSTNYLTTQSGLSQSFVRSVELGEKEMQSI